MADERKAIETKARREALEVRDAEAKALAEQVQRQEQKLAAARETEVELRRRASELEAEQAEAELRQRRALDAERTTIREEACRQAEEAHRLKHADKDKVIADLKHTIEDLQQKASQGSQQLQGEVQELDLESMLTQAFPDDEIRPVKKGQRGADRLQVVSSPGGQFAGKIIWESKRTKHWSRGWLQKLRDDQRLAKADVAVLLTEKLPEGVTNFAHIEGVWVTDRLSAIPLAHALRMSLHEVAAARRAAQGQDEKMEVMYRYLCGHEFRQRVQAILESFMAMKEDLDAERRSMERQWAKREQHLARALGGTAGMYGDLQGIAGTTLPRLEALELLPAESAGSNAGDAVVSEPPRSGERLDSSGDSAQEEE